MSMTVGWVNRAGNAYICIDCAGQNADESAYADEIDYAIDNEDIGPEPEDIFCCKCGNIIIEHHD